DRPTRTFLAGRAAVARRSTAFRRGAGLLVHCRRGLRELLLELLARGLDGRDVVALERVLESFGGVLDPTPKPGVDLVAVLLESLANLVQPLIGAIAALRRLTALAILGRVVFGVAHHALDVGFVEPARRLDANALLLPRRLVLRRHVEDAVRVDVERHFDFRN